jgi:DNA-binding CsgD family transcriptional regulator
MAMLTTNDYQGLLAVLEASERATSVSELRRVTLESLQEQFGYAHSIFLTGTTDEPGLDGVLHGHPQRRLDAHLGRLAGVDIVKRIVADERLDRSAPISLADIRGALGTAAPAFLDALLEPLGVTDVLAIWLHTRGPTSGFVGIVCGEGEQCGDVDRERMALLAPHLGNLLEHHQPRHVKVSSMPLLTPREAETVDLVAAGHSNRAIARHLGVTESTVKKHVSAALTKLDVSSRTQLTLAWLGGEAQRVGERED